jgi:hypothetical protein
LAGPAQGLLYRPEIEIVPAQHPQHHGERPEHQVKDCERVTEPIHLGEHPSPSRRLIHATGTARRRAENTERQLIPSALRTDKD